MSTIIINVNTQLTVSLQQSLDKLRLRHSQLLRLQKMTDTKLYSILEGCLELYYFVKQSDATEVAFKNLCGFSWGRKTKVTILIAKAVFGPEAKQVHTYAKAIERAVEEKIGTPGNQSMIAWLRVNGGVSGVVRVDVDTTTAAPNQKSTPEKIARQYTTIIGREAAKYGFHGRIKPFVNHELAKAISEKPEALVLCKANSTTGNIEIVWHSYDEDVIEKFYHEKGTVVQESPKYAKMQQAIHAALVAEQVSVGSDIRSKLHELVDRFDQSADAGTAIDHFDEIAA